jgi:hypothetical protein
MGADALLSVNALADCDDERVLASLGEVNDRRAAAGHSDESVSVISAAAEDAVIFELKRHGIYPQLFPVLQRARRAAAAPVHAYDAGPWGPAMSLEERCQGVGRAAKG